MTINLTDCEAFTSLPWRELLQEAGNHAPSYLIAKVHLSSADKNVNEAIKWYDGIALWKYAEYKNPLPPDPLTRRKIEKIEYFALPLDGAQHLEKITDIQESSFQPLHIPSEDAKSREIYFNAFNFHAARKNPEALGKCQLVYGGTFSQGHQNQWFKFAKQHSRAVCDFFNSLENVSNQ
ncbi:MAG: hypothetical protein Tsb0015_06300 [Simkaniaceae bacterium]